MEFMGLTSVAVITVICYLLASAAKAAGLPGKWLPTLCGGAGALLGLAALYFMPSYPAGDLLTAVAVGIVSGLAATGADQVVKQLKKEE